MLKKTNSLKLILSIFQAIKIRLMVAVENSIKEIHLSANLHQTATSSSKSIVIFEWQRSGHKGSGRFCL